VFNECTFKDSEYRSDEVCERQLMMLAAEDLIQGDI
jgi:hypothetical protein